jgi:hypothetical protein
MRRLKPSPSRPSFYLFFTYFLTYLLTYLFIYLLIYLLFYLFDPSFISLIRLFFLISILDIYIRVYKTLYIIIKPGATNPALPLFNSPKSGLSGDPNTKLTGRNQRQNHAQEISKRENFRRAPTSRHPF